MSTNLHPTYAYFSGAPAWTDGYLSRRIIRWLKADKDIRRVLDAGCGNGDLTARLAAEGFRMSAFDISISGVEHARRTSSGIQFELASGYDDLRARFGDDFDACVCVEVIEHIYDPRRFVRQLYDALRPDGRLILTTPYHGYLKNLGLALTGRMDAHYTALWDGGHIKFWSRPTLTRLLHETGFREVRFEGAGRLPYLWKSMILVAQKPSDAS
jgi:2-polyprenyl-3-methyl-5-hydroxy-6-metoxy-1,4-benzoquinol methylase